MADRPVDPAAKGKKDKQELSSPPKPRRKKKLLLIAGAFVITLGTIGSLAVFLPGFIAIGSKGQRTSEETSAVKQGYIYEMEHFIVNLADTNAPRYLKVKINLESQDPKPEEEFDQRLPQLRDAILTILSAKTYTDIYDSEGKMRLKEEILSKVNPLLSRVRVKTVYFTEFVVQ
ncbi:MAG: flagellar basal body-associated FliL family protein [Thermodesulfobacteriota bacterium]